MIRVLADRHHAGLFHSLQLLFTRLNGRVYAPRGHEWWDEGYWRFGEGYGDDRLARQFLEGGSWAETGPTYDPEFPGEPVLGVYLAEARQLKWDVVLATVQDNQQGYARFAREVGATYAVAVGNTGQYIDWSLNPLVLNSSEMPILPGRGVNIGQESGFGFQPIWYRGLTGDWEDDGGRATRISSFANCMTSMPCWPLLDYARKNERGLSFRVYGIDGPDGNLKPISNIQIAMTSSGWGWHDKTHGDGFGHVIHYWASLGRPLIGHAAHYRGKRAEGLWDDLVTCIDLDKHDITEAMDLVREISADPERHNAMGRAIRDRYEAECDWQRDAELVGGLLGLPVTYGMLEDRPLSDIGTDVVLA